MNQAQNRITFLLEKYRSRSASEMEERELYQLIAAEENETAIKNWLLNILEQEQSTADLDKSKWQTILQQILDHGKEKQQSSTGKLRTLSTWKRIAVAASLLITIGIAAYVISTKEKSPAVVVSPDKQHDVQAPQTNRAQIKLADGSILYLDSAANGELVNTNGVTVTKTEDGKIVYSSLTNHDSPLTTKYNTLINPRGSKVMHMTLSDGSQVWLNAGSSITYPVVFNDNERKVNMDGEAYFEVAHDKTKPFFVSKGEMTVQVLGTHFNVNAYNDEENIKVTLLEGSVQVSVPSVKTSVPSVVKIKPGEQAVVTQNSELRTFNSPDLEATMAWKNGQFSFSNSNIQTVMRQIARWYDVEIIYDGTIPNEEFNGGTSRQENVSAVLNVLEATGKIKFKVEGKKVIVTK